MLDSIKTLNRFRMVSILSSTRPCLPQSTTSALFLSQCGKASSTRSKTSAIRFDEQTPGNIQDYAQEQWIQLHIMCIMKCSNQLRPSKLDIMNAENSQLQFSDLIATKNTSLHFFLWAVKEKYEFWNDACLHSAHRWWNRPNKSGQCGSWIDLETATSCPQRILHATTTWH